MEAASFRVGVRRRSAAEPTERPNKRYSKQQDLAPKKQKTSAIELKFFFEK